MSRRASGALPGLGAALVCAGFLAALASCTGARFGETGGRGPVAGEPAPAYPSARWAVLSDPHVYDPEMGSEGEAFQRDMDRDRKLLPESREILSTALGKVRGLGVDFLLVPGDLTKDGEKQDHLLVAQELAALSESGVRSYVVPGNHDILNPSAVRYDGRVRTRVPNVTPSEFAEIYRDAGYGEALFRDPGSLSYVAEPVQGLWLLAVDSASYADNPRRSFSETGDGLTPPRVAWIRDMLRKARGRQKAVIVMMHHGAVEHFSGQSRYFSRYLVGDWRNFSDMLSTSGVRVVFTGHFHAQDIALRKSARGDVLYDVETGSLVTFPNPIRLVTTDGDTQRMKITSLFVRELPSFAARGIDFWKYSDNFVRAGTERIAAETMKSYGLSGAEAAILAAQVTEAMRAHFRGDERFTGMEMIRTRGLSPLAALVVGLRKDLIAGLWTDPEPPDNDLVIHLSTGAWEAGDGPAYDPARASSSRASFAFGTVSSGFTLYQARWIFPFSSTRNEERMMPLYVFP